MFTISLDRVKCFRRKAKIILIRPYGRVYATARLASNNLHIINSSDSVFHAMFKNVDSSRFADHITDPEKERPRIILYRENSADISNYGKGMLESFSLAKCNHLSYHVKISRISIMISGSDSSR